MISRLHRLTKSQVAVVKNQGQAIKTPYFTLVYSPSHDQRTHFAVVVSKRISPKAVLRNQLRRRYYSLSRRFTHSPLSILIIPHQGVLNHQSSIIANDLIHGLETVCSNA